MVPIQLKNDQIFDDEVSDPLFRSMGPFLIGMFDDGDTPRPVIRIVFALASERPIVKFVSRGSSVESDQSSDFAAYGIWCAGLSPEAFPLVGGDIGPYRRLLDNPNNRFGQYGVQSFEGTNCVDEVLEARDGLSRHWKIRGSSYIATYAEWIPNVSSKPVTLKCKHPRGVEL